MSELKVTVADAIKAHRGADQSGKKLLEDLYGKNVFDQKITDRVKSFDDACREIGVTPKSILPYDSNGADGDALSINAHAKLIVIARALNEGWTPDWDDSNEAKWYPYFDMRSASGFGFSYANYGRRCSGTSVGYRLCFKTRDLAEYAGKQFESIYKELLTLQ